MSSERLPVTGSVRVRPVYCSLFTVHALLCLWPSVVAGQIQDNSFLLEEAYNQEAGVVQHISAFQRVNDGDWAYSFTQEWPLGGITHQLSYTVPLEHSGTTGTGIGDLGVNYRYQLIGHPEAGTLFAPRFTLLLPTGSDQSGRGTGTVGFQANLPLTILPEPGFAFHGNAGVTVTPSARSPSGGKATTFSRNVGASLVWLMRPSLNLLVEAVWLSEESAIGEGLSQREETTLLNPGIRAAFDFGALQIVPGLAYTIALSPDSAEDGVFLYLSFEHPFRRQ